MTDFGILSLKKYRVLYMQDSASPGTDSEQGMHTVLDSLISVIRNSNAGKDISSDSRIIIGISGSVAVGKSTFAEQLRSTFLSVYPVLNVNVVSTDNFLFPARILKERNIMSEKGFPVSYDYEKIISFLTDYREGKTKITYPCYSHDLYDITDTPQILPECNILILEGINTLSDSYSIPTLPKVGNIRDFLDASIFLDASDDNLYDWFRSRFLNHLEDAKRNQDKSHYAEMIGMSHHELQKIIDHRWYDINYRNFRLYIQPSMIHANLVVRKGQYHDIFSVHLKTS